jgi:hypothetical protein
VENLDVTQTHGAGPPAAERSKGSRILGFAGRPAFPTLANSRRDTREWYRSRLTCIKKV